MTGILIRSGVQMARLSLRCHYRNGLNPGCADTYHQFRVRHSNGKREPFG